MPKNNWTNEELILALYWYCTKIPFSKIKYTKAEVIDLAKLVGRTPSAAAFKLVNLARLDPTLQKRGVKGMSRGSKTEKPIWDEYFGNWDELSYTAEKIIAKRKNTTIEIESKIATEDLPSEGKEREKLVKIRINQKFFSDTVKLSYGNKCCITGISMKELLVASHIKPWSKDLKQAANPENGLCLNGLHDKAFDKGLFTLSEELKILLSPLLLKKDKETWVQKYFLPYDGLFIIKPTRFMPSQEFLQYHRSNIFVR